MEADFSKQIYIKCCTLKNRVVKMVLKSGDIKEGVLAACATGNELEGDPSIIHWLLVPPGRELAVVIDCFGNKEGEIIHPEDIDEIHFTEDNSVLKLQRNGS
jgi:hypothetical protein